MTLTRTRRRVQTNCKRAWQFWFCPTRLLPCQVRDFSSQDRRDVDLLILLRSLLLDHLPALANSFKNLLSVLVELKLVDHDFRGVDTDWD